MTLHSILIAILVNLIITATLLGLYHRNFYQPPVRIAAVALATYTDQLRHDFARGAIEKEVATLRLENAHATIRRYTQEGYLIFEREGVLGDVTLLPLP